MKKEQKSIIDKNPNIKIGCPSGLEYEPSGFPTMDMVLGGGEPKGVVIEHWGEPGCGKTTYRLQDAARYLNRGEMVIWYDLEHALSKLPTSYLETLGIDRKNENFIYIEPVKGSHELDLQNVIDITEQGGVGLIVIDSVAQLDDVAERGMDKQEQAVLSKFLKRFLRKILDVLAATKTKLVIINQITTEMHQNYTAETTPGGHNPKFITWARIRFGKPHTIDAKGKDVQAGEEATGFTVKVIIKKTRGGRPHLETELRFDYDKGFNKQYDAMQHMIRTGKIVQSGAWYQIGDKKFQGQDAVLKYLSKDNGKQT